MSLNHRTEVELNIDSYSLKDILDLFNLSSVEDLSDATINQMKKKVLMTHPDKSGLDPKYFLFYKKAFDRLKYIYEYKSASKIKPDTEYSPLNLYDDSLAKHLTASAPSTGYTKKDKCDPLPPGMPSCKLPNRRTQLGTSNMLDAPSHSKKPMFDTKKFNEIFEKCKLEEDGNQKDGYGDWLKSDEDLMNESEARSEVKQQNQMEEFFRKKKEEAAKNYALTNYKEVSSFNAYGTTNASSLNKSNDTYYGCSDPFGKLQYDDVKHAYTESIIPVALNEYDSRQAFRSVDDFKRFQAQNMADPLSREESNRILNKQNQAESEMSVQTAYYLATEMEAAKKRNQIFASHLHMLER